MKKLVQAMVVGVLGSLWWASEARAEPLPLVLDAGLGALRLKSGDTRFSGDATLGYATRTLGLVANGFLSYYDLASPNATSDYFRSGGGGDLWYLTNHQARGTHLELRASGGGHVYSSDSTVRSLSLAISEASVFGRGSLQLGLKLDPSDTFFLELLLGGGGQLERFLRDSASNSGSTQLVATDKESFTFRADGRVALRWRLLPGTLATRLRATVQTFSINRTTATLIADATNQTVTEQSEVVEFRQTEVSTRLFLDLEAASIVGITPGLYGGFDLFAISGTPGSVTTAIPSLGLGLFHDID